MLLLTLTALAPARAGAEAAPPPCATTTAATAPTAPAAGAPCWTDVDPYPFGADGNPVDTTSPSCSPPSAPGPNYSGDQVSCYLKVDSLAFRSWNRGLAATSPSVGDLSATTAYGVWLFNGTRWFPDPTFPGQSVCKGKTVLWAGKRDYWLVGARVKNWPALCRFDGVNFEWQPLDIPKASLDRVPVDVNGRRKPGAINAGACLAWDNCWFFGSYGIVVHWDGNVLTDASPDVTAEPWLGGDYAAATARVDATGHGLAFAVTTTGGFQQGQQSPPQPDGSPPPQLFGWSGTGFSPQAFAPPTVARPGDPYRTDLVAVDFDAQGNGWAAGDPVGYRADPGSNPSPFPSSSERRGTTTEPAPLMPLFAPNGCTTGQHSAFTYANTPDGNDAYLWSSIAVFPGTASAAAGGQERPASASGTVNDDGLREPVLAQVSCDAAPVITRFRLPDPFAVDPAHAALVPADRTGAITTVAANAVNDAWAASSPGVLRKPTDVGQLAPQRPHLYRLLDTQPPLAPAGDDNEPRPVFFQPDPTIIIEEPPPEPPPPPPPAAIIQPGPRITKRIRLKPAVYRVRVQVRATRVGAILSVTFMVRRPVRLGVEALRRRKVVSASGLKRFHRPRGRLVLRLDRRHWPTRIRFVTPPSERHTTVPEPAQHSGGAGVP